MTAVFSSLLTRVFAICLWLITITAQAAIEKSPNDHRDYLSFTLPNQMKVLVISDPATDKAAASLDLNVGTNANPANRQGLAHFLEHMLFLGTEKYPQAGSYQAFISQNGGNHNAYTAFENTNYFFDVRADTLSPALDRFARFFIDPLFTEEYVDRERHAVHSEYQSKLRDDGRRSFSATKQVMNPEHPYSAFAVGSLETLSNQAGDLRKDLISFYNRYYSANLMTLVILGKESTAELKAMAETMFGAVKNRNASLPHTNTPVYQNLPLQLNIQSVKDIKQLQLTFPIPATRPFYREKPGHYIASMLGYEGKGSLFSALKQQGWANGLAAYSGVNLPDQSSLTLSISLTDKGYEAYNEVIATAFAAIRLLQTEGVSASLYEQEQQMSALQFRFKEASQPIHYVGQLARNLQHYPAEQVISADYMMTEFRPDLIDSLLNQMTPDNVLVTLLSQNIETNRTDPWFKARFQSQSITPAQRQQWLETPPAEGLATRQLNPFVADDLSLVTAEKNSSVPIPLKSDNGRTLWYKHDTDFGVPKADFWFTVITNTARASAANTVMTQLFTDLLQDSLNEPLYDASQAGLSSRIYAHAQGFSVRISGYNDKQPVLLDTLLRQLQTAQFQAADFERIKALYQQDLDNSLKDKPYNQTIGEIYTQLLQSWSTRDKQAALAGINLERLHAFIPELLTDTEIRILANGNLTAEEATRMADKVIAALPGHSNFAGRQPLPIVQLSAGQPLIQTLPVKHNDSAITVYFQGPDASIDTRAQYALLAEALSAPFYSQLRTEQQLGYVVFGTSLPLRKAPGLAFVVQSPNTDPVTLARHIDQFLTAMKTSLEALSGAELQQYKASLLSRINRQATRLSERTSRYWQAIDRDERRFDSREQLSQAVTAITPAMLQQRLAELPVRRLTVQTFGEQHQQTADTASSPNDAHNTISALSAKRQYVPEA